MGGEPGGASAERLRASIENAIGCLGDQPLEAVLRRTFVRGALTQEAAAEVLGLLLQYYRRHLAKAVEQLDVLWAVEIGEVRLPAERLRPLAAATEQRLSTIWPGD